MHQNVSGRPSPFLLIFHSNMFYHMYIRTMQVDRGKIDYMARYRKSIFLCENPDFRVALKSEPS